MKVAVIADDLTGAAEIGGIGLRYGLKVEIAKTVDPDTKADMVVIDTDARSITQAEAVAKVSEVSHALKALHPQLWYKKIDSVMRGHVLAEIKAQCEAMQLQKTLVVPANPALGRTLVGGHYYVHGEPLHSTSFGYDPEFPVTDAHVASRFNNEVIVQSYTEPLPSTGVVVGEAATMDDIDKWTHHMQNDVLLAGAAAFFTACMDQSFGEKTVNDTEPAALRSPILYVSGSTFEQSAQLISQLHADKGLVCYMPAALMHNHGDTNTDLLQEWTSEVAVMLQQHGKAVMAIPQTGEEIYSAKQLRIQMALAVKAVFDQMIVRELVIEGGSTAAAILEELNINSIFPTQELTAGVIRNAAPTYPDLHITLKPGSYKWSNEVWAF
ncbi:four-carbon acid sugar kinase family protein [Mucilaginibacter daejeonensis]|uniref:four-carbon acid sugar kinase family protein n=1 Tax=Mucilaginibacter daejeonensis TaxID=398049 RepID=UPI001D1797B1|nr:four-carbon acid sugar kinase family protein [Mucilaginibacter daejeonensis]UEG54602.1 four-carbon acid sugar kinase family protein [Mucilaginibacter daejeonensis]